VGFVVDKVALERALSKSFPLQIFIPSTAPHKLIVLSSKLFTLNTDSVVK
jgi:hypothetical protein